jgi:hypothetical protein
MPSQSWRGLSTLATPPPANTHVMLTGWLQYVWCKAQPNILLSSSTQLHSTTKFA